MQYSLVFPSLYVHSLTHVAALPFSICSYGLIVAINAEAIIKKNKVHIVKSMVIITFTAVDHFVHAHITIIPIKGNRIRRTIVKIVLVSLVPVDLFFIIFNYSTISASPPNTIKSNPPIIIAVVSIPPGLSMVGVGVGVAVGAIPPPVVGVGSVTEP